jgi:DNA-binding Xre family transcriptional regulator
VTQNESGDLSVSPVRLYPVTPALRDHIETLMSARQIEGHRGLAHRTAEEISHATVHRIRSGQSTRVRYKTLVALAEALSVPLADLIEKTASGPTPPWILRRPRLHRVPVQIRDDFERSMESIFDAAGVLDQDEPSRDHDG